MAINRYKKNPTKSRERAIKWNKDNPFRRKEIVKKWEFNNREKVNEKNRKWSRNNRKKLRIKEARRRARLSSSGGSYTSYEWNQLVKQQENRCLACGKKTKLTVDHVIPVSKGGTSNIDNLQGLCFSCNSSKGAKPTDYRKKKGIVGWIQDKLF